MQYMQYIQYMQYMQYMQYIQYILYIQYMQYMQDSLQASEGPHAFQHPIAIKITLLIFTKLRTDYNPFQTLFLSLLSVITTVTSLCLIMGPSGMSSTILKASLGSLLSLPFALKTILASSYSEAMSWKVMVFVRTLKSLPSNREISCDTS